MLYDCEVLIEELNDKMNYFCVEGEGNYIFGLDV